MVTIIVPDYDQAIDYFTRWLGFALVEDSPVDGKRWVVVSPGGGAKLLLARAADVDQAATIGRQAGGRVGFFLHTDDFEETFATYQAAGVTFVDSPRVEPYGRVVVFADVFGNRWDLIEPVQRKAA
ncbi:MAG: VOC family protein [Sphingomonas sp.]|nr:VOC family protein [Sphingomonas sp.]